MPLVRTMLPCIIAGSQAARPSLCLWRLPVPEITAKLLPVTASSLASRTPIPQIGIAATEETRVPPADAAAVSPKSP
jgi:hypothetical protein